jgi:hypothetical protein
VQIHCQEGVMDTILWDLVYAGAFYFMLRGAWSSTHHERRRGHDGHFVSWEPLVA